MNTQQVKNLGASPEAFEGGNDTYFRTVSDYIHLNPARAGMPGDGATLSGCGWSNFLQLTGTPRKRPTWLEAERVLGIWGEKNRQ